MRRSLKVLIAEDCLMEALFCSWDIKFFILKGVPEWCITVSMQGVYLFVKER